MKTICAIVAGLALAGVSGCDNSPQTSNAVPVLSGPEAGTNAIVPQTSTGEAMPAMEMATPLPTATPTPAM